MNWIKHSTSLDGEAVKLMPLEEAHFNELCKLAEDKRIWEFIPIDMSDPKKCIVAFSKAIAEREKGTQFPFVIFHKKQNKIIGSTRLMNIEPEHKKLEIGWTWLHPDYWASEINLECKFLLLSFCFEELKAIRVQLKTDENNMRSRKAIEKIGGLFEGILRQDMIRENGTLRNSVYFSLLDREWIDKKMNLEKLLNHARKN